MSCHAKGGFVVDSGVAENFFKKIENFQALKI